MRVGLDLGGSKLEVVVCDLDAEAGRCDILLREREATHQEEGYEAIVARTAALLERTCRKQSLDIARVPIGVGMPGGVERRSGAIKNSNTTCLNGRPFRSDLERAVGRPLGFENDANCFALAEATFGAARPYREGLVFGVIMGTGVGGGLVMSGRVWSGPQGLAGEWGHHGVFAGRPDARACYCGQRGCLEAYASGPAVERHFLELAGERKSATEIAALAASGNRHAEEAIESLVAAFGRGLANVIDICDPTAIVLGGGLSRLDLLYGAGRDEVARRVFNDELTTPIVRPALGDSAGVIGAALVAISP
ncbi:MAG: ROK family protein [Myxococcales bacterium]|nr:ROK family protein [Myxococcales bacterium]